jgi:hypothetical protein
VLGAFFPARDRMLLSGDAVLTVHTNLVRGWLNWALGTRPPRACAPPKYTNWDQAAADASLAVLAGLTPRVVASGHGAPLVGDGPAQELHALAERTASRRRSVAVAV